MILRHMQNFSDMKKYINIIKENNTVKVLLYPLRVKLEKISSLIWKDKMKNQIATSLHQRKEIKIFQSYRLLITKQRLFLYYRIDFIALNSVILLSFKQWQSSS